MGKEKYISEVIKKIIAPYVLNPSLYSVPPILPVPEDIPMGF